MCTEATHTEELQAGRPGRRLAWEEACHSTRFRHTVYTGRSVCSHVQLHYEAASISRHGCTRVSTLVNSCGGNGYFNHMYYEAANLTAVT